MFKKLIILLTSILLTAGAYFLHTTQSNQVYLRAYYSFLVFTALYTLITIIIEFVVIRKLKASKSKHVFKRVLFFSQVTLLLCCLAIIWIEDPKELLVAYGIIGAGVAIAMQDLFKNILGGILILINRPYQVGDRININTITGDVMDISVIYTTLLEIRGWVDGDQATGRIIKVPNSQVLTQPIHNYTEDHEFIWDELMIPLTYDSDWKQARDDILAIAAKETEDIAQKANTQIKRLEEKYYLDKKASSPTVFVSITDNWIALKLRYMTETRSRRHMQSKLSELILEKITSSNKINVASQTIEFKASDPTQENTAKKKKHTTAKQKTKKTTKKKKP